MRLPIALLTWCVISAPVAAETVAGRASVIDGDTIEIHGVRIRLHGVDAPESGQVCWDADRRDMPWGRMAAFHLAHLTASSAVTCHVTGADRYYRKIARCSVRGKDLGAAMVEAGMALAYRRYSYDYVAAEMTARASATGMWGYDCLPPWEWRALENGRR